jgi:hypothetical protein
VYFRRDEELFRASITGSADGIAVGAPALFLRLERNAGAYSLTRDGRVIMAQYPATRAGATAIDYVANWTTELARRVPR